MKVFCWNVQGRVKGTLRRQVAAVLERKPEIVALQEVTEESYPGWREGLEGAGYQVVSAIDSLASSYPGAALPDAPIPARNQEPDQAEDVQPNRRSTSDRRVAGAAL